MTAEKNLNVIKIKENEFKIQSHSNPEIWYYINLITQVCSCPHYQIRLKYRANETCKHYKDLINYLNTTIEKHQSIYKKIENEIEDSNNNIPRDELTEKYGEEIIDEMLKLGMVIEFKRGYISIMK